MGKPKANTRARDLLMNAEEITIMHGSAFRIGIDSSVPEPGDYKIIPVAAAAAAAKALDRADARDEQVQKRYRAKPKKKVAARKVAKR